MQQSRKALLSLDKKSVCLIINVKSTNVKMCMKKSFIPQGFLNHKKLMKDLATGGRSKIVISIKFCNLHGSSIESNFLWLILLFDKIKIKRTFGSKL